MFTKEHMSVGDWFIWHILMLIPVVNLIVFIISLSSSETTPSLQNYIKFQIVIWILAISAFIAFFGCLASLLEY